MTIVKKVQPEYFQKIVEGVKKYELRLANFDINKGDTLILKEWDPVSKQCTGREISKIVTAILKTKDVEFWDKKEIDKYGFQIISFEWQQINISYHQFQQDLVLNRFCILKPNIRTNLVSNLDGIFLAPTGVDFDYRINRGYR